MKNLSLKLKIYGILAILFLVVLVSGWVITNSLKEASKDTEITNALGRQRMLTQAMGKSVLGYAMAKSRVNILKQKVGALNEYITQMRGTYTQSVIATAKKAKLVISMNPNDEPHPAVPFPATFTRWVNEKFGGQGSFGIDIFSESPINPNQMLKSERDHKANRFLKKSPDGIYSETFEESGKLWMAVYIPDKATVQACASCHTRLLGKPFQVGDILGIRQYKVIYSDNLALGKSDFSVSLTEYETARDIFEQTLKAARTGGAYPARPGNETFQKHGSHFRIIHSAKTG